ncbi:MAG: tetratricopeptide repeat protein [Patescibacteria group bacterium]|nr:tetratricopeptide repeat protein [Patescibacteria group bacterium]
MTDFEYGRLLDQAIAALEQGDFVRAVAIADQLVAVRDDDGLVRNLRAQALLNLPAAEEALDEAHHAVRLEPNDPQSRMILGMAAWELGRLTLAQQAMEQGIRLSGDDPELLARYAWFLACERGPKLAAEASERAIQADERSSMAWASLGLAQLRQHRLRVARESLRRALQNDPSDPHAQAVMLSLLKEQGNTTQADALVDLMTETPATEAIIREVREESHRRRLEQVLLDRHAVRESMLAEPPPSRRFPWALAAVLLIPAITLIFMPPAWLPAVLACVVLPMVLLLWWFRE